MYCDRCLKQLDELEQLRNEAGPSLTILTVFAQDKGQLKFLEDRYGKAFSFVPDARKYIQSYNLGQGYPMTYLLDKNKLILQVLRGASDKKDWLYGELIRLLQ